MNATRFLILLRGAQNTLILAPLSITESKLNISIKLKYLVLSVIWGGTVLRHAVAASAAQAGKCYFPDFRTWHSQILNLF